MTQYPWLALVRGINVGGKRIVRMATLREVLDTAGFKNVKTHIQSGNILFTCPQKDPARVRHQLEDTFQKELQLDTTVIIRTPDQMQAVVERDPFSAFGPEADIKRYVSYLADHPEPLPDLPTSNPKGDVEIIGCDGSQVFSVGRKLGKWYGMPADFVERTFGVAATTRNWNVTCKLAELCRTHFD